jgi:hypothetical protein
MTTSASRELIQTNWGCITTIVTNDTNRTVNM